MVQQEHAEKVVAVVVSRDRDEDLRLTLAAVWAQDWPGTLDVILIDSSANPAVAEELAQHARTKLIRSDANLGGAGGFALGLLSALAAGADWIWLMDDDGRPAHDGALSALLGEAAARKLDAVAPVVLDPQDQSRFAFPYIVESKYVFERAGLGGETFLPRAAHLFNGLLLRGTVLFRTGVPDLRLFIRGDEIDFLHRLRRAKVAFGTTVAARFTHPSSNNELHPVFGGLLHVVYPEARWKRRTQYRNRAYNYVAHQQYLILVADLVRYPYFFLFARRFDLAGLREWLGCTWDGLTGNVYVDPAIDLTPRRAG